MAKDFSITINQSGNNIILSDTTVWADEPETRVSKAVVAGILKYNDDGSSFDILPVSNGSQNIAVVADPAVFSFDIGGDGYCKSLMVYADLDTLQGSGNGRVLFTQVDSRYFIVVEGVNVEVTYEELIKRNDIHADYFVMKESGFSSFLEKSLDSIWKRYETVGLPHEGKDFRNFYTGYALLLGAISSLRQSAFFEFDRKIKWANKLVSKWL